MYVTVKCNGIQGESSQNDHLSDRNGCFKMEAFHLPQQFPEENVREERNERMKLILNNKSDTKVNLSLIASFFSGIAISVVFCLIITMWPVHNPLGNSQYWYETIITGIIGWEPFAIVFQVNTCLYYLGTGGWNSLNACVNIWIRAAVAMFIMLYHIYIFWVYVGEYAWPFPFGGYFVEFLGWLATPALLWFQFPKEWKMNQQSKRKLRTALFLPLTMAIGEVVYKGMLWLFQNVNEDYQWTLAFVLVIAREVNTLVLSWVGHKITGKDDDLLVEILSAHYAAIKHILFLSVNLVNATPLTSTLILSADFGINIFFCAEVLWYIKNPSEKNEKRKEIAMCTMIINETVEFIMPIIYSICLLMAYFGPNAEVIGNVKNGLWQFVAIEDINVTYFWLAVMFLVDVGSTIITTGALQIWGNLNVIKSCIQMQKEIGWLLALQQGYLMIEYFNINVLSNACDFTLQFDWLNSN